MILSIDPATTTGWCFGSSEDVSQWKWGIWKLQQGKETCVGSKLVRFEKFLEAFIRAKKITGIVYEIPVIQHVGSTIHHAKIAGCIEKIAYLHNVLLFETNPSKVKKYFTGKGNAKKEEMVSAMQKLGFTGEDHNESDAFSMLLHHFQTTK